MHVAGNDDFGCTRKGVLARGEELRNDPGHVTTVIEHGICHRSHEADRASAEDQGDVVLGEDLAELPRRFDEAGIGPRSGTAINTDASYFTHRAIWRSS